MNQKIMNLERELKNWKEKSMIGKIAPKRKGSHEVVGSQEYVPLEEEEEEKEGSVEASSRKNSSEIEKGEEKEGIQVEKDEKSEKEDDANEPAQNERKEDSGEL